MPELANKELQRCADCVHVEVCKHVDTTAELTKQLARSGAFDSEIHRRMLDTLASRCLWWAKSET